MANEQITSVAVLGLGAMGSRIAHRILGAGYHLIVWNRSTDRMKPLTRAGAHPAANPADAAGRADAVITMVADPDALTEITTGETGLVAGVRPGAIVLEMSTVGPAAITKLAAAMPGGVHVVDAPVLGSLTEVEAGDLRIFVGGRSDVVEKCTPLLSTLGTPVHVGDLGHGAAAKLVANTTLLGVLGVLGEAISLSRQLGLPLDLTFDVLATTPLAAQANRRRSAIESGVFPRRFALSLARKDAALIVETAEQAGADLRMLRGVGSWFAEAEAAGRGDDDYSAILAHIAGTPVADD